jgi:hypothetical protein
MTADIHTFEHLADLHQFCDPLFLVVVETQFDDRFGNAVAFKVF